MQLRIAKKEAGRRIAGVLFLAAAGGILASCANKYDAVTPEVQATMLSDLRAGRLALDCGARCSFTWIGQVPAIHALDIAERWDELAVRVMQIGFGQDLAYYYLGQAAQGLGYHQAAIVYYNAALGLANGQDALLKCEGGQLQGGDPCQGVNLAAAIPVLVQASRDVLAQQAAATEAAAEPAQAPVHHHHHVKPAIPVASSGAAAGGWVAPPPPSATPPSSGSAGWVAPPPAPSP